MMSEERLRELQDIADYLEAYLVADDNKAIVELLAEVRRLRAASEWRPIESAPKDGTCIMLLGPSADGWLMSVATWHLEAKGWQCEDEDFFDNPTHWMPLPEPPK